MKQNHMNCEWEIKAFAQPLLSRDRTLELINEAFEIVKKIECKFSVFKKSKFNEVNKYAGLRPVEVDDEIWQLLSRALEFCKFTQGKFNVLFATENDIHRDFRLIVLNSNTKEVFLPFKKMKISLGGIGKGYAVDQVFNFLKEQGLVNFLVNGSGDLRCHSHHKAPRSWRLGITNPFNTSLSVGVLEIKNSAMATSGVYKKGNHISNNDPGRVISATVITPSAEVADLWGTFLCSCSCSLAIEKLNSHDMMGLVIDSTGKCYTSKRTLSSQKKYKEHFYA